MTIFVERLLIQLNGKALDQLVCHSKLNFTAVVAENNQLYIFDESTLLHGYPWKCPSVLLSVKWHPSLGIVVVGLNSGEIYTLILDSKTIREIKLPVVHSYPIQFLEWASESQLLSLDSVGLLTVWNHSKDNHFQKINEHDVKDTPSQMTCFRLPLPPWECFIGSTSGAIYHAIQDVATCVEVVRMDRAIQNIVSHEDSLCVLTSGGIVSVYRKNKTKDGIKSIELLNTVKISGKSRLIQLTWLSKNVLALTGGDLTIRLWNCQSNDTFLLPLPDVAELTLHPGAEHFTTLAYLPNKAAPSLLSAATNLGGIVFWRDNNSRDNINSLEDDWHFIGLVGLPGGSIEHSIWGTKFLFVHNGSSLYQIVQQQPFVAFRDEVGLVQLSSSVVAVQKHSNSVQIDLPVRIAGIDVSGNHLLVWGEEKVVIYRMGVATSNEKPFAVGNFECGCLLARLHKTACFCLEGTLIQMRNFQGSSLCSPLSFMDSEGSPVALDISGHFLCVASSSGYVKLWDVANSDPKLHINTKNVASNISGFMRFRSVKTNSDGTCISFTADADEGLSKLFIWRTTMNSVEFFNVAAEWTEEQGTLQAHFWDEEEPRIVVCQLRGNQSNCLVSLLVADDQQELLVQDVVPMAMDELIGVQLPHYAILDEATKIHMRLLASLASLNDHSDKAARDALLSFSCHLRRGRVEQAYQAVRPFTNPKIWESLARSCVQLRRPDVGLICLGKLGNAKAAAAVRSAQAKYVGQVDAITAVLAVQLGMIKEAEAMCEQSSCYDLLSRMYQASNRWEAALQLAHTKDRINLKRTYYEYARYLEGEGKTALALEMYEKCQTHHFDVPRMLFEDTAALQSYCTSGQDPERLRWWAQFLESSGEMDAALDHYARAGDYLSLVRLHCYLGDLSRATELAEQSQDRAACFHVARQYEANDNVPEALKFFGQASAYGNAVRLCKEHELDDQLYRYAMQGEQEEMVEAARYFEAPSSTSDRQPRFDRAVMLYSKAGLLDTALDLASRTEQHEAVLELSRRLDKNSNPASLQRCADYLASHRHYGAAVDLLVMAGKYSDAVDMCLKFNVTLTEALADQLGSADNNSRLLLQLAEVAQRQGDYQLAAKKFTQAGDKYQAMKALMKSGDTDRVIFFANVSRQPDIYILAGNYLQTLDWRSHPEYVKHIVTFYTKARSLDLLVGFYEACAQAEVDEYQSYDNAMNALKEAHKIVSKTPENNQSTKSNVLAMKMAFLEQFINIKQMSATNSQVIPQFESILSSPGMDLGILRPGNVYATIFQLYVDHQMHNEALQTLDGMKTTIPNFMTYLDRGTVSKLCFTLNLSPTLYLKQDFQDEEENPEDITEIISQRK
ncbi:Intraflagellar transport protein 140 [Daphnia magna]|uniref:Intraflagellar transport protein 140 n=1 Tax=Daphnia magna TaxID=35525 RepID=A0A164VK28_9CRUS|nr:Intraflagellar transport protein 140 [Daphnia magna]